MTRRPATSINLSWVHITPMWHRDCGGRISRPDPGDGLTCARCKGAWSNTLLWGWPDRIIGELFEVEGRGVDPTLPRLVWRMQQDGKRVTTLVHDVKAGDEAVKL